MDLSKNNDAEAVITIDDDDDDDDNDDDDDDDDSDGDENVNIGNLEFSVSEDKVEDVNSLKEKVESLYSVTINEDIKAKETDDKNAMRQWFNIVGPLENCRQAKAFILASCDPGQAAIFEFDPTLHKILSCESQKMRIEKESKTILLFDSNEDGSVVIQGADEISVGVAMSLLEAAAYEASVAMMSPCKEHQALQEMFGKGDNGITMGCSKVQTESSSVINCDDRMEVDISDLELATGEVALDVIKSPDPEIQRLVKCGRDKNYDDEEIREVLDKSKTIPKASAFFRALHTCRNMKAVSSESSVHQSNKGDAMTPYSRTQPSDSCDFKLNLALLQRNNSAQEAKNKATSATNKNGTVDRELSDDDVRIQRVVQAVENSKTPSRMRYPANQDPFNDSAQSVKPVMNLMSISDAEERKRLAEANQQRNRKLFLEQSCASASPKVFSYDRVANLDEFTLAVDVNISDSSLEVNVVDSPSVKKRHKKKKKKNIDLTVEESNYRSRSPNKPTDQNETALRSQHGLQARQLNAATATVTQAGHHPQSVRVLDYFHKKPGVVSRQTDIAPTPKQIPNPNPPAPLLPPFAFAASRSSVTSHLRYIVIDGSNIAMAHGNGKFFSCRGIEIAVQHFRQRGHKEITVFVPQWRRQTPRFEDQNPIRDQDILEKLKDQGIMNFTPSRRIPGKRNIVCYDDRFILRLAQDTNGIVVSNDNYRDLYMEKPEWAEIIEKRVLSFTFVRDLFMLPDDPLGRGGPNLDDMLSVNNKTIQSYPHNNSRFQLHPQASNARQQFQQNSQFFAQQTPNSCVPVMPQWQTVPRHSRQGYPNTGQWIRPPHAQDIGQWTNKINHVGIPVQTGRFPFRTSSAPFVSHNIRENSKFIVERAPSSQSSTATGSFLDQTPKHHLTNSRPQHLMQFSASPQLRSDAETKDIKNRLMEVFPEQEEQINGLLLRYTMERDINVLIDQLLGGAEEM